MPNKRKAICEQDFMGTFLNSGCIPTKMFVSTAKNFNFIRRSA